jgi:hypothetical protein
MVQLGHCQVEQVSTNSHLYKWTFDKIYTALKVPKDKQDYVRCPAAIPSSIMRRDIPRVVSLAPSPISNQVYEYGCRYKSNGDHIIVVFDVYFGKNVCLVMDRFPRIYLVPIQAPSFFYLGETVLDGELLELSLSLKDQHMVEVMDVLRSNGTSTIHLHMFDRMQIMIQLLQKWETLLSQVDRLNNAYINHTLTPLDIECLTPRYCLFLPPMENCFHLSAKPIFAMQDLHDVFNKLVLPSLTTLSHLNDVGDVQSFYHMIVCDGGVKDWVLYSQLIVSEQFRGQYHNKVVECKWSISISTSATDEKKEKEVRGLQVLPFAKHLDGIVMEPLDKQSGCFHSPDILKFKIGCENTIDFMLMLSPPDFREGVRRIAPSKLVNIPTKYYSFDLFNAIESNGKNVNWVPLHVRQEKSYPNSFYTVEKTIQNIEENIDVRELYCNDQVTFHPDYISPLG